MHQLKGEDDKILKPISIYFESVSLSVSISSLITWSGYLFCQKEIFYCELLMEHDVTVFVNVCLELELALVAIQL